VFQTVLLPLEHPRNRRTILNGRALRPRSIASFFALVPRLPFAHKGVFFRFRVRRRPRLGLRVASHQKRTEDKRKHSRSVAAAPGTNTFCSAWSRNRRSPLCSRRHCVPPAGASTPTWLIPSESKYWRTVPFFGGGAGGDPSLARTTVFARCSLRAVRGSHRGRAFAATNGRVGKPATDDPCTGETR
jgi:hypothetical protein